MSRVLVKQEVDLEAFIEEFQDRLYDPDNRDQPGHKIFNEINDELLRRYRISLRMDYDAFRAAKSRYFKKNRKK